jgi:hypothetical protein
VSYPKGKVARSILPHYFGHPLVKGVFHGGCIARGKQSSFRASAHAHGREGDKFFGWICYRAGWKIDLEMLALHEIAHLIAGVGHTDEWRRAVIAIGGTLDPAPSLKSYQKRVRPR